MDLQQLLEKWNIKCDINTVLSMWNESHRLYHNLNHLNDLISQINEKKSNFSEKEYEKLMLTAVFHDVVYDPTSQTNEEDSAKCERILDLINKGDNADSSELKKYDFTVDGFDPKSLVKPRKKKTLGSEAKLSAVVAESGKGSLLQALTSK